MRRIASGLFSVAVLGAGTLTTASSPASAATLPTVGYTAQAYGSNIYLGNGALRSGPTSMANIACTTTAPLNATSSAAALTVPRVGTVGAVTTQAHTSATSTAKYSSSSSRVASVNLLGGVIRGGAITSGTVSGIDSLGRRTSNHSSSVSGLVVNGRSVPATSPANTQIPLVAGGARYGTVVLNQQARSTVGNEYRASTTALVVSISGTNPLGLPTGTTIQVGTSRSTITQPIAGLVTGAGYSTAANLANGTVVSSPQAVAAAPCAGGSTMASLATLAVPNLGTTGSTETHATARVGATSRYVAIWNDTTNTNLLAGVVTAKTINARTSVTQTGTGAPSIGDASRFLGLQVRGVPAIKDDVAPNTVATVPGLGRVTFHKVSRTSRGVQVTMIEIVLSAQKGSLPAGSVVRIGSSYSALR
jgi:hypothetical protein